MVVVAPFRSNVVQLRSEAQGMYFVGESMPALNWRFEEVLKVVDVHVAVAETAARRKVKVSNNLVHANRAVDPTSFMPLLIQLLGVMLSQALLYAVTPTESPRCLRVRLANLVTGITAAGLLRITRRGRTVTGAVVFGV